MKKKMERVEVELKDGAKMSFLKDNWKALSDNQQKTIIDYDAFNKTKGLTLTTRRINITLLIHLGRKFPNRTYQKLTLTNYQDFLINKEGVTLNTAKAWLRLFYKSLHKRKLSEVEEEFFKASKFDTRELQKDDMFTEEEIQALIDACTNLRDKAWISLAYDCALERKALYELNLGDVEVNESGIWVKVRGKRRSKKTYQKMQCILSYEHMGNWIKSYPEKLRKPDAPLFIALRSDHFGNRMGICNYYSILQNIAIKANVKKGKRIFMHLFRHSALTNWAEGGMNEFTLRKGGRFAPGSKTPEKYIHMNDEDIDISRNELATGNKPVPKKREPSKLIPIKCPRCGGPNDRTNNYCSKCFMPLNQTVGNAESLVIEMLRSKWYKRVQESLKIEQSKGKKVPVDLMVPDNLLPIYMKVLETPEEREKRINRELKELDNMVEEYFKNLS
jgi:integrase